MRKRNNEIPEDVDLYVEHAISIAKQINLILKKQDKNQTYLAEELKKSDSEISKWMSGTHNFTLKTISKIEAVLKEKIILCPREIQAKEVNAIVFTGLSSILVGKIEQQQLKKITDEVKGSFAVGETICVEDCSYLSQ